MKHPVILLLGVLSIGLTSGCVSGRRSFDVAVPSADSYTKNTAKGAIAIGPITDARHFENKPSDPSTPSIHGDVNDLSVEAKSRFIGRQRNTYGHSMGDITFAEGQTVQTKVADLLREGLKRRGYDIAASAAPESTVNTEIQQFWSWMTPGFIALSFEAQITCKITVTSGGKQASFIVKGYGLNHGQVAKDGNWQEAFEPAFQDFLKNLGQQLDAAGF